MHKDKILITGSKGLIGNALKKSLEQLGMQVIGIDIDYPIHHEEHGDIRDHYSFKTLAAECVGIVHLAAFPGLLLARKTPSFAGK